MKYSIRKIHPFRNIPKIAKSLLSKFLQFLNLQPDVGYLGKTATDGCLSLKTTSNDQRMICSTVGWLLNILVWFSDINTNAVKLSKFDLKYQVLSEFMNIQADEVRNKTGRINQNQRQPKFVRKSTTNAPIVKENLFVHLEREASNEECHPIFEVRKSVKIAKPMDKLYHREAEELASGEVPQFNPEELIGYIDPLGFFWINEGFDSDHDRLVYQQLEEYRNSFFEYDPIRIWKQQVQVSFLMIFEIINIEFDKINKKNVNYEKYINLVFKNRLELNMNFSQYFARLTQVNFSFFICIENIQRAIRDQTNN